MGILPTNRCSVCFFAMVVMVMGMLLTACSGSNDDGDSSKEKICTVCVAGTTVCDGSDLISCSADGSEANVQACLAGLYCNPVTSTCELSNCPDPFYEDCADSTTREVCVDGGFVNEPCGDGEVCSGGVCVPGTCTDGDTRCGHQAVLTCTGGAWDASDCGAGQTCYFVSNAAQCAGLMCEPGSRECWDGNDDKIADTVRVCSGEGTGHDPDLSVDCAKNNGFCEGGFCRCGTPPEPIDDEDVATSTPDISEPSGIDIVIPVGDFIEPEPDLPPVQIPDKGEVIISGDTIEFKSYASVNFLQSTEQPGLGTIQIVLAGGTKQIEIQIVGVPVDWTGYVDADMVGSIGGFIGYNDGTTPPEIPFKYGAGGDYGGTYSITLEENGERVIGEFSGLLNIVPGQQGPEQIDLEDGLFDVAGNSE